MSCPPSTRNGDPSMPRKRSVNPRLRTGQAAKAVTHLTHPVPPPDSWRAGGHSEPCHAVTQLDMSWRESPTCCRWTTTRAAELSSQRLKAKQERALRISQLERGYRSWLGLNKYFLSSCISSLAPVPFYITFHLTLAPFAWPYCEKVLV